MSNRRIIFVLSLLSFLTRPVVWAQEPCLKTAWSALDAKSYLAAIRAADECIDNFRRAADRAEAKLQAEGIPEPPTGSVSDADKSKLFKQGLLNDVATAYFIKGRAAEALARKKQRHYLEYRQQATDAYDACCHYKHARTWDPRGWFWSPCEAAQDRKPLKW